MTKLSIVIPVYNAADRITNLVEILEKTLSELSYEVVLVNDGSKDASDLVCSALAASKENVNYVCLMRNYGEFNAVMCGLNEISGDYVVIIDDDFQNPPSEIVKLLNKIEAEHYDIVYSYYAEKKHSKFRNLGSALVNTLLTYLIKKPKDLYLSSFKMMTRQLVDQICQFKTPYPYIDGIVFMLTQNIGKVEVKHDARLEGGSSYTLRKLVSLFLTVIFGYSLMPIRLILFAGLFSILFALIYMVLYFGGIIGEWGSPVIIFLCGVLLCALAVIGEYVGKTLMILNGVPQFVYRKKIINNVKK